MIREMIRLRLSQILVNEEYKQGKFKIPVHLALGHEAIAVAVHHAMGDGDKLILSHRNIAYNLARLGSLRPVLDEYLLKPSGLMGGKLGSMNLMNPARGIVYTSSILGNDFPVSCGIAFAEKVAGGNNATFVLGGDGSMEEGSFYESLVMMKTLQASTLVIIENNEWSLATSITERRCSIDLQKFTQSVNIPYFKLHGNDVSDYLSIIKKAREDTLQKASPVCIEVLVKTLGDWRGPQTPEHPDGKFINYHAGPSPSVDITKHFPGAILQEGIDDPLFVAAEVLGREKFVLLSNEIIEELGKELHPS